MKRMKILTLATAAQLGAWVFIAGEPAPESFLRRTAGQVQAACWTGGAQVDVPPAPRLDPKASSPVKDEGQIAFLQNIAGFLETRQGPEVNPRLFDALAGAFSLPARGEKDVLSQADQDIVDGKMRSMIVRRAPKVPSVDIILAYGMKEGEKVRFWYYLTSAEGRLRKAIYKENGARPRELPLRDAAVAKAFAEQVASWRKWHHGQNRQMLEQR